MKKFDKDMVSIEELFKNNFSKLINYLCFCESEDFLLCKKFYESKIKPEQEYFSKAIYNRAKEPYFGLEHSKEFLTF